MYEHWLEPWVIDDDSHPSTPYPMSDDDFNNLPDHSGFQDDLGDMPASGHVLHDRQWSSERLYTSNAFHPAFLDERGQNDEGLYTQSTSTVEGEVVAGGATGFEMHSPSSEWNFVSRYAIDWEHSRYHKESDNDCSEWSSNSIGERDAHIANHERPNIAPTANVTPAAACHHAEATAHITNPKGGVARKAKTSTQKRKPNQGPVMGCDAKGIEGVAVRPRKIRRKLGGRLAQPYTVPAVVLSNIATIDPSQSQSHLSETPSSSLHPEEAIMAAAAHMSKEELLDVSAKMVAKAREEQVAPSGTVPANESVPNQAAIQNGCHDAVVDSDLTGRTVHRANARTKASAEWSTAVACRWQNLDGEGNCGATFAICNLGTKEYLAHLMQAHSYVPQPKPMNRRGDKPKITCRWASTSLDGSARPCGQDMLEESLDRHLKANRWMHVFSANPRARVTEYTVPGRRFPRCQREHTTKGCR